MKYLRVLKALIKINIALALTYRKHFISSLISSMSWGVLSIITILLLTSKVSVVFGWTREELILLTVVVNIVFGTLRVIFDTNFWEFSRIVHYGELDSVLSKPIDSQFRMSVWKIDLSAIVRVCIYIALLFYLSSLFHLNISFGSVLFMTILCLFSITLLYSFFFIALTFTIWFSNLYNLMDFANTFIGTSRYPKEMYTNIAAPIFFFLLPLIIIISTPTKALLQKSDVIDSLLLIMFTIIFFAISRVFWKFALRFYTSASG